MRQNRILLGVLLGGLTAFVVEALGFLGSQLAGLPRASFVLFDWLARLLPGNLITLVIDSMVSAITRLNLGPTSVVAKRVEQSMAVLLFAVLGALLGSFLASRLARDSRQPTLVGAGTGAILGILVAVIALRLRIPPAGAVASTLWLLVLFSGWGWILSNLILALVVGTTESAEPGFPAGEKIAGVSRRQFLWVVGIGSVTVVISAAGLSLLSNESQPGGTPPTTSEGMLANAQTTSGPAQSPSQADLEARLEPAPGTRPELTSNENFYRIDINTVPPTVEEASWQLELGGLVSQPLRLSLAEIRSRPSVSQAITLECISNQLGGDLISTSRWTGVRLKDLLEEAGLGAGAQEVYIEAVDGFYESVPLSEAMDERTLLVYAMNGEPLPTEHGFPLRIYIPNHFGMKQPKWITRMEVIDHQGAGYWVERGWSDQAIPPTTSVIDTVDSQADAQSDGMVPVGGIAYAGARGISRVEVQVDDGDWQEAELRTPPLSPLTWVQWRYNWEAQAGEHTFKVRAYDGSGALQETNSAPPHPDGATGIYNRSAFIET